MRGVYVNEYLYLKKTSMAVFTLALLISLALGQVTHVVSIEQTYVKVSSCIDITSPGYYYLSHNISGVQEGVNRCIGIYVGNVVLDGNGYSLVNDRGDGILVYKSYNVTVKNLRVRGYDIGITFDSSSNSIIENVAVSSSSWSGIYFTLSSYNTIVNVTVSNSLSGIYLYNSSSNIVVNVVVVGNGPGIWLIGSGNNTIASITTTNNADGIAISISSNGNRVLNSIVSNNVCGISIGLSSYNTVASNIVSNNSYGLCFQNSSNNLIYNNYFKNLNVIHVYGKSMQNTWNITKTEGRNILGGSYLGGNYWGFLEGEGFSDTCSDSDSDGICDNPFGVDENNVDYLPLRLQLAITPAPPQPTPTPQIVTPSPTPTTTTPLIRDYAFFIGVGLAIVVLIATTLTILRKRK